MKELIFFLWLLISAGFLQKTVGQTLNWTQIDSITHIVNAHFGYDYSVSYGLGYGYKINSKLPIVVGVQFSTPVGYVWLDDFKTKLGGHIRLFNKSNFVGTVAMYGIYRRYENSLVTLQNFGSEFKGTFGYYQKRWFVATEVGFDKAIITHFKHTTKFTEEVYADVLNGWYEPATGGNFYYGLQTGFALKQFDITLNFGSVLSQDFNNSPLLPFYLGLGCNYGW